MPNYQQANVSVPVDQRIAQYVAVLRSGGHLRSLQGINTALVSDRCLVVCKENNAIYMLRKESSGGELGDEIIVPAAGLGRWFRQGYELSATAFLSGIAIPPFSTREDATTELAITEAKTSDMITVSCIDTALPSGVVVSTGYCPSDGVVRLRLANVSSASVSSGSLFEFRVGLSRPTSNTTS